jgi:hypothetical protein
MYLRRSRARLSLCTRDPLDEPVSRTPTGLEGGEQMKKLNLRVAGPVRLTAAACSNYHVAR